MIRDSELDAGTLRAIVEGTSAEVGEEFFDQLVKHLAQAMGTKAAWVTEWLPDVRRLRAFSFWVGDGYFGDYEYEVPGTPCEAVVDNLELIHVPARLLELYPGDPDLAPLGAVSYMGAPLLDLDGSLLGHVAVLHDQPLPESERARAIFRIFAGRAAAELRRLRRDRVLREREQELSTLIDSAMDAILVLDEKFRIAGMNRAAEETFGVSEEDVAETAFEPFVTSECHGRLIYLSKELARQPEGRQSVWLPDGLTGIGAGGAPFPAEATLSRFEVSGRPGFTLILRNVNDRIEAERRIRALIEETAYLREEIAALQGFDEIVGTSDALRSVLADIERVAATDTTVLITGETGTGKELIARALHERSLRAEKPLIKVNCAAIPQSLQESEFFGHVKGAFTGATQNRDGRFKLADGGTIFLDEVGELPLDLQVKLLRVLQEGEFEAVGGTKTERVDVRVIAATNRDLDRMVGEGKFRSDLLYRLNVFPIHSPPLRERGDDVVLLAESFARSLAARSGRTAPELTADCRARLLRYDWPGNVRELHNVIERAWITSPDGKRLDLERAIPDAPASTRPAPPARADDARIRTASEMQDFERENLVRALEAAGWKVSGAGGAAELLGLNPNTLSSRMKALGIERPR